MKNDLQLHKKSDKIKWIFTGIAFLLVAVMLTGICLQIFGTGKQKPSEWFSKPNEQKIAPVIDENGDQMESGKIYNMPAKMMFTSEALAAADEQGVTVTLEATVYPVDAKNKTVDWTLEWLNAPTYGESSVTDFITLTPKSDGSNIVDVTCLKPFGSDTIVITVTTREGGFTASCTVSFVGHPSSMSIVTTGASVVTDEGWNVPIVELVSNTDYVFDFVFDNVFHSVDSNFVPNFTCEFLGVGTFNLHKLHKENGRVIEDTVISASLTDKFPYKIITSIENEAYVSPYAQNLSYEFVDGKLKLKAKSTISAFNFKNSYNSARTSYYQYTFDSFTDESKKPYYEFKITETNTGLSQTFNVRVGSNITGVTVNSELSF